LDGVYAALARVPLFGNVQQRGLKIKRLGGGLTNVTYKVTVGGAATPGELDADPWLLNVENGTIDLGTGELRKHKRENMITKLAPVTYDPEASARRFERFLRKVLVDDEMVGFVRRFAGYSLTGSTRERVFAILWGSGKNGKSTLIELLRDALGDYARNTDVETILRKRYSGVNNDVAALKGARFVSAAEVEQGRALAESKVKNLTGSDTVTARFLFAEPFDFRPEFKLWLSTNNKPMVYGQDDAIWDRIRLIPFTQRFEGEKADPKLPDALRAELAGVLAWLVRGCLEWQREGLGEPEGVKKATEGYRAEMDMFAAFREECCVTGQNLWVEFKRLYAAWEEWCVENHEEPGSSKRFAATLTERGYEAAKGTNNVAIRKGIGLLHDGGSPNRIIDPKPEPEPDPPEPPPGGEGIDNSVTDPGPIDNSQNPCKSRDSGGTIIDNYR
jgi:putative DNA primase/helicase